MNRIPVAFTFDDRIILGASVAIKSLINAASAETSYDIYVLHNGISKKNIDLLSSIVTSTHTITFKFVDKSLFKGVKKNRKSWTEIVYYRMLLPEVFPNLDKLIYSDVDVFFKGDLTEVYNTDISNFYWGGVRAERNTPNAQGHKYFPENENEFIYWSGFMLINCKKCREEKFFNNCMKVAFDFYDRLQFFDLDILNIASNGIASLPLKYCTLEPLYSFKNYKDCRDYRYLKYVYSDAEIEEARNVPTIIHYAGELGKPWHRKKYPTYYANCLNEIPRQLKRLTFRDIRKRFFSKV